MFLNAEDCKRAKTSLFIPNISRRHSKLRLAGIELFCALVVRHMHNSGDTKPVTMTLIRSARVRDSDNAYRDFLQVIQKLKLSLRSDLILKVNL